MHQGDGNWRHVVSDDLARWTRLPDALAGGGAWDGGLTLLDGGEPVILFDCRALADCLPPAANSSAGTAATAASAATLHRQQLHRQRQPMDPPIVGVARPAKSLAGDFLLVNWTKDSRNPIVITHRANGTPPYSGPSNIWRSGSGKLQMKMIQMASTGWTTGLYELAASSAGGSNALHSWDLKDPYFYPTSSGGGGIFHRLPGNVSANCTHIMGVGSGFAVGRVDSATGRFVAVAGGLSLTVDAAAGNSVQVTNTHVCPWCHHRQLPAETVWGCHSTTP